MAATITGKEEMVWQTCECGRVFGMRWGFVTMRSCPECVAEHAAEFWRVSRGRPVSPPRRRTPAK
jgi:hypothetical protein